MKNDRARHTILPLSKFNIMQITRQRIRPEVNLDLQDNCYACQGTGKITPLSNIEDEILKSLRYLLPRFKYSITITVHPFVYAYLHRGFFSKVWQWRIQFKKWIRMTENKKMSVNSFNIIDKV